MPEHTTQEGTSSILANMRTLLPELEALYKDIHSHPELSMQETRTAGIAADRLEKAGYEVTTGVGRTGVVGLLRNGQGPTVMLRADMDALPIAENTGLAYASKVTTTDAKENTVPVGHMCGHDMHVAWLVGAATLMSQVRDAWKGTLMAVFQPGEETAQGAQAMIDDGLLERFPHRMWCSASTSWSAPPARSPEVPGRSPPRPTACKFACSGAAHMVRCRKPASTPSSWPHPSYCGSRPSCPARSPLPMRRWSRSACCRPARRRTSFPTTP
jgi:hypothetical protein